MNEKVRIRKIERYEAKHAPYAHSFYVNPDSCENPEHFESYIRYDALGDYRSGMATTHVMVEYEVQEDETEAFIGICGFISLKATALITSDNESIVGDPAIEIAELAVNKNYEKENNGRALLEYAVNLCDELRDTIGAKYLLVCAAKKAVEFYKHILPFGNAEDYYIIPREIWNEDCIPLYFRLPEKSNEPRFVEEDDE